MKQLTVKDLLAICKKEVQNGNGDRIIVISDDNEGNGYHGLFYHFTIIDENEKKFFQVYDSQETDINKIIVLG